MTKPILIDVPENFETERLIIRAARPGDGKLVYDAALESQKELMPWMPWAVDLPDAEQYEVIIREGRLRYLAREDLWMLLFLKKNGALAGGSGLHRIDWDVPKFEIGYWVRTALAGRGLVTEAVNGITDLAFNKLGAKRVEIRCDSNNERSAAVARRAGYKLEATLRNHRRNHLTEELSDTLVFTKLHL